MAEKKKLSDLTGSVRLFLTDTMRARRRHDALEGHRSRVQGKGAGALLVAVLLVIVGVALWLALR